MTDISTLTAELRDRAGKGAARATRRSGQVPGVIYGAKQDPVCIALDPRAVWQELKKPGLYTRLFDITVGGTAHRALCRDVQFHPVTDQPLHLDFQRVNAESKLHIHVPVHFANEGASPGLKKGGVLNIVMHEVEVVCGADNIPKQVVIDLTGREIGDSIHLSTLEFGEGVRPVSHERDATVASIAPPTVRQEA